MQCGGPHVGERKHMPFGPKITAFLAAICVMPNVTRAARAAKIKRSQHYTHLKSSPEYAAAFQQALQIGMDALSDVAVTRATDGWEEPVVYQGRIALQEDLPSSYRQAWLRAS